MLQGMTLGLVKPRCQLGGLVSNATLERPELTKLLVRYGRRYLPGFHFSSIQVRSSVPLALAQLLPPPQRLSDISSPPPQVNYNFMSVLHVDSNNLGPSAIVGVGNFSGGGLWVQGQGGLAVKRNVQRDHAVRRILHA